MWSLLTKRVLSLGSNHEHALGTARLKPQRRGSGCGHNPVEAGETTLAGGLVALVRPAAQRVTGASAAEKLQRENYCGRAAAPAAPPAGAVALSGFALELILIILG